MAMAIVEETLARRRDAGVNVSSAVKDFQSAQTDYNNREFKEAYSSLRKAYQSAVK